MGILPLKIIGKISSVGLAPHRWMQGTSCRLEQLMMPRGLRSINSSYEVHKTVLPHV